MEGISIDLQMYQQCYNKSSDLDKSLVHPKYLNNGSIVALQFRDNLAGKKKFPKKLKVIMRLVDYYVQWNSLMVTDIINRLHLPFWIETDLSD